MLAGIVSGLLTVLLLAQEPSDRCTVEGQVLRSGTSEPVGKALVVLRSISGRDTPYASNTDGAGKFAVRGVAPGKYRLSAERNGYVRAEFGQRSPDRGGSIVSLAASQNLKDVTIKLVPSSVITGRVMNEEGERMNGVRIELERYRYVQGKRQLVPVNSTLTNDLGEYRLYGIAPGRYFVSSQYTPVWERYAARVTGTADTSYIPLYYPNTPDPDRAVIVEVTPGSELRGIDFTLTPVRTAAVRGKVTGPPGGGTSISLMPAEGGYARGSNMHTSADSQGNFELRGVAPGSYFVIAVRQTEGANFLNGRAPVQVGPAGVDTVEVPLAPLAEVAGQVRTVDNGPPPKGEMRVLLEAKEPGMSLGGGVGFVKPDGSFRAPRIAQGPYSARMLSLPEDYYTKAVRRGGEDLTESGFTVGPDGFAGLEIVISPAGGKIEGAVVNDQQQTVAGATVVLAPEPAKRKFAQYFRQTITDQDGRFALRGIPPGDYKLFSWDDIESGAWLDPDFIRTKESAGKSVAIGEGARESVTLGLAPGQ